MIYLQSPGGPRRGFFMSAVVPWWPVAVYGASRCSLKPDVVSLDHMNEWLAAHPDVIRTDFKRKLRYPAWIAAPWCASPC
jgi:hypothetical protein